MMAQYSAAHRRHGLASDTTGCGSRSRGFRMKLCRGTASAGGFWSAIIIATRHISISNRAAGVAGSLRYLVVLLVIVLICATNGRIPRSTGEYMFTSEAKFFV